MTNERQRGEIRGAPQGAFLIIMEKDFDRITESAAAVRSRHVERFAAATRALGQPGAAADAAADAAARHAEGRA
jgi:hypothetical protein